MTELTPASRGPVWTAAAVARRLGIAPGTLRSWDRRYGIGPAAHTPGRHRRYTDADIAELVTMRALVAQGMVLPAAAAIVRNHRTAGPTEQKTATPASVPAREPEDEVAGLVAAAAGLDLAAATGIVAAGLTAHGAVATWERLCRPAFDELDTAVAGDRGCVDSQLLLSWVVGTCLRRPAAQQALSGDRPVLLACPAGEQHTLALDALFAALVERGVPARMLGPAVPTTALRHAARHLRPSAVVLWAQRAVTAKPGALRGLAAHTDAVLVAGPGWQQADLPAALTRVGSLRVALDLLVPASLPARASGAPTARSTARPSGADHRLLDRATLMAERPS